MSIFQSFREYIDEVKKEMEEEEKRQKQKTEDSVTSDEFLERLEQVRQSNREHMETDSSEERVLPQRSQRRNEERQNSDQPSRRSRTRRDNTDRRGYRQQDYYEDYDNVGTDFDSVSNESEVDLYHAETRQKMKASARRDDFWSDTNREKKQLKNRERKEFLRQGMIMKEILDTPRSKKRRTR